MESTRAYLPERSSLRVATRVSLQEAQQKKDNTQMSEEKKEDADESIPYNSLVGKRVSKYFGNGYNAWFDGTVASFQVHPKAGPFYRISYDDGDTEDLSLKKTLTAIDNFRKRHPSTSPESQHSDLSDMKKETPASSHKNLIGKRIFKSFRGFKGWQEGTVTSLMVHPHHGRFCRVRYDDGDTQDLTYEETLKAISNYEKHHVASPDDAGSYSDESEKGPPSAIFTTVSTIDQKMDSECYQETKPTAKYETKVASGKRRWKPDSLSGESDNEGSDWEPSTPRKRRKELSTTKDGFAVYRPAAKKKDEELGEHLARTSVNNEVKKEEDKPGNGFSFFSPLKATAQAIYSHLRGAKLR